MRDWKWRFFGFESKLEGQPVQDWFDHLPLELKEELADLIGHMQNVTDSLWGKPEFDRLKGAGGISEFRLEKFSFEVSGKLETVTPRIYGFFSHSIVKNSYTFLYGTLKTVRNDKHGKRIAKIRLGELERREATVHDFKFEDKPHSKIN